MSDLTIILTDQFVAAAPNDEIPRDAILRKIDSTFNPDCQQQMIFGPTQSGKTNLLAQFARQHNGKVVSYFITSNPFSQLQHNFLYSLCFQLSILLVTNPPEETIDLAKLKSLFTSLCTKLIVTAQKEREIYYFVIDGLEWAFSGVEGERIIDLLPVDTKTRSPYLLTSCRSDMIERLPERCRFCKTELMSFSLAETEAYFFDLGLTTKEVKAIQEQYYGIPGYLKIIKDTKRTYPNEKLIASDDLNRLLEQQLDFTFASIDNATRSALEYLAVCPAPLTLEIIADLTGTERGQLTASLKQTSIIQQDISQATVEYRNELLRENVKRRLGDRVKALVNELIEIVSKREGLDFLLALLYKEAQDYTGLKNQLTSDAILSSVHTTGDISHMVQQLRIASDMAKQQDDIQGLLKWTLGIAAAKSFVEHTVDQDEIWALLAIGDSQAALRKAYSVPETASRIRLLARAYTSMREKGERISQEAKEELLAMIHKLPIENLDKEIARGIAVDLLPILPDAAILLLEKTIEQRKQQSIIEVAVEEISTTESDTREPTRRGVGLESYTFLFPSWLRNRPFANLLDELKPESTKAKEYIIREWCKQNSTRPDIVQAINLWLDVVEDDRDFVIVLRSLRQLSEVVINVSIDERKQLIERLKVPRYMSIDAPKEEWIRLRLNLAEALFAIEPTTAWQEIVDVHTDIIQKIIPLDEQAFCFARLRLTLQKVAPERKSLLRTVEGQFQQAFDLLLQNSAEHYDALHETLQTLVAINPDDALIVASELNTRLRRTKAFQVILETTLCKWGENRDVSGIVKDALDALERLDELKRDDALLKTTHHLRSHDDIPLQINLDTLLKYVGKVRDVTIKAYILANIAILYQTISSDTAKQLLKQAVEEWSKQDDLTVRLVLGFNLVQTFSKIDIDYAKDFYHVVQQLQLQPGASLATGQLGTTFVSILDQAIRALTIRYFSEADETVHALEQLISRVPAHRIRIQMYGRLASSAYRTGHKRAGDEFVRTRLINAIRSMQPSNDRDVCVAFCLPVIFAYDQEEAEALSASLPVAIKNEAWHSVMLWCLSQNLLGDYAGDSSNIRIQNDRPRLQLAIKAMKYITYDFLLLNAITAVANSVEASFEKELDSTQSLDLLVKLDEQAHDTMRLPDPENIRHQGYVVLAESAIHRAKSVIFNRLSNKRGLSKRDIDDKWTTIYQRARTIPNIADRVFVLALVAKDWASYQTRDRSNVKPLLDEAYGLIGSIPAMVDRLDRVETIADAWRRLGEKEQSKFVLKFILSSINELQSVGFDGRLAAITQLAYKIAPEFADEIVSRFDTRKQVPFLSAPNIALEIEKLIGNPSRIDDLSKHSYTYGAILGASAQHLLQDFASGKGNVFPLPVLERWLQVSQAHPLEVSLDVSEWVVESLYHKYQSNYTKDIVETLLDVANLVHRLARWISPELRAGIPESIQDSFSGLGAKYVVFQAGETERAKRWLANWLNENVSGYLIICDPYFDTEQLQYFRTIPMDCRVVVVTTDKKLDLIRGVDVLKTELDLYWRGISSQTMPTTQFIIVPKDFEDTFHDRVIISKNIGLDIGQSLNGIGKSRGKLNILADEEAKELERTYLNDMLNQATWFMQHGVNPAVFFAGG